MKKILLLIFSCLVFAAAPAFAAAPLVSADWLVANQGKPNLVVLDLQPAGGYQRAHIPGTVNTDYARWRTSDKSKPPKTMPSVEALEAMIGGLGIDNGTHVVLVSLGQSAGDMASATRIYWTFKALGHDEVSILDGGLIGYARGGGKRRLERQVNTPTPKVFKAQPRAEYLLSKDQVMQAVEQGRTLVDSRSRAEFLGIFQAGGKERPGTIPGAVNVPFDWLTVNGGATFHAPKDLQAIYKAAGVLPDGEHISFCHTGHRTSLAWFVTHELLGNKKARMYDGSMAEWAVDSATPLEQKVELECKSC